MNISETEIAKFRRYDDTLSDILCFLSGIKFSATITGNKKISQSISFIKEDTIREIRIHLQKQSDSIK